MKKTLFLLCLATYSISFSQIDGINVQLYDVQIQLNDTTNQIQVHQKTELISEKKHAILQLVNKKTEKGMTIDSMKVDGKLIPF